MNTMKSVYIVLIFCCIAVCGSLERQAIENKGMMMMTARSYFDIFHDANAKLQLVNSVNDKVENSEAAEKFETFIYKIYRPLMGRLSRRSSKIDTEQATSAQGGDGPIKNELVDLYDKFTSYRDNLNMSSICINDTGRLLSGLVDSKPWAVQFFDATGKPGPALTKLHLSFVGDYDQCKKATAPPTDDEDGRTDGEFEGNYCVVSFYTENPFLYPLLGACLPSTCSSDDISSLFYDIVDLVKAQPPIVGISTQCLADKTEITAATIFAIIILSLCGILMFFGTLYDILRETESSSSEKQSITGQQPSRMRYNSSYESIASISEKDLNRSPTNSDKSFFDRWTNPRADVRPDEPRSRPLAKILLSFSVCSNGRKLLNTTQSSGTLGAIHGIRFISMCWVVLGHTYVSVLTYTSNGVEDMPNLLKRWTFLPISNALVSVDSFFTLSGLLTAYLTIQEMTKRNTWKINWVTFYFHRFWRLTPPYMFSLVIFLGLGQYMGRGPLWANQQPQDKEFCEKNWWTNLLYVNNLVNYDETCFGHAWYLANDMQFFILSPLMLIPFYYSRFTGILSCLVFLLVNWIATGTLGTSHKWSTSILSLKPVPGRAPVGEWMEDYYVVPWCRIGPFIVGIMAGYCLALSEGKPFRMNRLVVLVGWITAVASGLAVVYGIRGDITGDNPSTLGAASFYNAVGRSVWGACVCWVVIACSAGYGGPVNTLLSWSPFVVLGRLTYMAYLIHPNLLAVFFGNLGALFYLNDITIVTIYLGILVIVNMAAFICVLALESPLLGIEKAFLKK